MKKKILLVIPDYDDFPDLFERNLQYAGFETYVITDAIESLPQYKLKNKGLHFFRKIFKGDRSLKQNLIVQQKKTELSNKFKKLPDNLDYILVIRPDHFDVEFIKALKLKTQNLIAYQWDGFAKFPNVKSYIPFFDSFFCFETEQDSRLKFITNFYFDFNPPKISIEKSGKLLLYFVGLYRENREKKINRFIDEVSNLDIQLWVNIQYWNKKEKTNPKINYIKKRISFAENIENVQKADVLLDFVDPLHHGLSLRFFEALYYKKKVITDNKEVKKYDFYHPNNIFLIENENYSYISEFLTLPYFEINDKIVQKYSFSSWIKEITKQ